MALLLGMLELDEADLLLRDAQFLRVPEPVLDHREEFVRRAVEVDRSLANLG